MTTPTLDRKTGPRALLLRTLAANVILYERVQTTAAKARAVQPIVERCVTLARTPTLRHRRQLLEILAHPRAVEKMLAVIGPRFQARAGGCTRRIRGHRRVGDGAEVAILEFVS